MGILKTITNAKMAKKKNIGHETKESWKKFTETMKDTKEDMKETFADFSIEVQNAKRETKLLHSRRCSWCGWYADFPWIQGPISWSRRYWRSLFDYCLWILPLLKVK